MMNKDIDSLTVVLVLATIVIILVAITYQVEYVGVQLPQCQEDQVLLGTGSFSRGRWTSYECGPAADDFAPFSDIKLQACGEGWYHTLAALDEALIRLER